MGFSTLYDFTFFLSMSFEDRRTVSRKISIFVGICNVFLKIEEKERKSKRYFKVCRKQQYKCTGK